MKIYKTPPLCILLVSFVWSWSTMLVSATWWLLTVPPHEPTTHSSITTGAKLYCNSLRFLSAKQKELCVQHPDIMRKISEGVHLGVRECGYQFRNSKWNCTMYSGRPKQHAFEPVMRNKGKERAFLNAILSASVSFAVTQACTRGDLKLDCGCARMKRNYDRESRKRSFEWGGCSDDVKFGDGISRDFFEENIHNSPKGIQLLDLHNKAAGRREVSTHTKHTCRCHGITGSCQQNICWNSNPPIRDVSTKLFQRYNSAIKVRVRRTRMQPPKSKRQLDLSDLVYLKKSPKFCKENLPKGSYGTAGRKCNVTSTGPDGCDEMCCHRGYNEVAEMKVTDCNCKFQWCCIVNCEKCSELKTEHYCK